MLRSLIVLLIITSINYTTLIAQGLNNNHEIDDQDVKNAFNALGIEFFKFPIASKDTISYLNYYIEEYNDTSLIYSSDNIADLTKRVPKDYLPAFVDGLKMSVDTDYFRILVCTKNEDPYSLNLSKKGYSTSFSSHFDPKRFGIIQSRAFKYRCPERETATPVLVVYANNSGSNLIHCPQGAPPERIKKLYNYTLFVYIKFTTIK